MTDLFAEIEKRLADANDEAHVVVFGRCTAFRSPGVFCKIRSNGGERTLALGEGETCREAMTVALAKLAVPVPATMPGMPMPAPKPAAMPGMTTMPGVSK